MLFDFNFVLPKDCAEFKCSFYLKIVLTVSTAKPAKPLRRICVFTRHLEHLGATDSSFSVQEQSA